MNNTEQKPQSCQTDVSGSASLPTPWAKMEQIETWIGGEVYENKGGRAKLTVIHYCGDDKKELIDQLKTLIAGLETGFDWFAS